MQMNGVMKIVKDMGLEQSGQTFGNECGIDLKVRLSAVDDFEKRVGNVESCRMVILE